MRKTFKYRLYPNRQQQRLLEQQLEECRRLYNHLLAARRDAGEHSQASLRLYDQQGDPARAQDRAARCGERAIAGAPDRRRAQ
jgi:transposase